MPLSSDWLLSSLSLYLPVYPHTPVFFFRWDADADSCSLMNQKEEKKRQNKKKEKKPPPHNKTLQKGGMAKNCSFKNC